MYRIFKFCMQTRRDRSWCIGLQKVINFFYVTPQLINVKSFDDSGRYYRCAKDAATGAFKAAEERQCREGYAFDPSLPDATPCRLTNGNPLYCVKATCAATFFGLQSLKYPTYKPEQGDIGVFCKGDAGIPDVFRCGRGSYLQRAPGLFNAECVLRCSAERQTAPNLQDLTTYFVCYRVNGVLQPYLESCFAGQKFDATLLRCV